MKNCYILLLICLLAGSCSVYHISTKSLVEQLAVSRKDEKVNIIIAPPYFIPISLSGDSIKELKCVDRHEHEKLIMISTSTMIRVTRNDNLTKEFPFQMLLVKDSMLSSTQSGDPEKLFKPVKLDEVKRIRIYP